MSIFLGINQDSIASRGWDAVYRMEMEAQRRYNSRAGLRDVQSDAYDHEYRGCGSYLQDRYTIDDARKTARISVANNAYSHYVVAGDTLGSIACTVSYFVCLTSHARERMQEFYGSPTDSISEECVSYAVCLHQDSFTDMLPGLGAPRSMLRGIRNRARYSAASFKTWLDTISVTDDFGNVQLVAKDWIDRILVNSIKAMTFRFEDGFYSIDPPITGSVRAPKKTNDAVGAIVKAEAKAGVNLRRFTPNLKIAYDKAGALLDSPENPRELYEYKFDMPTSEALRAAIREMGPNLLAEAYKLACTTTAECINHSLVVRCIKQRMTHINTCIPDRMALFDKIGAYIQSYDSWSHLDYPVDNRTDVAYYSGIDKMLLGVRVRTSLGKYLRKVTKLNDEQIKRLTQAASFDPMAIPVEFMAVEGDEAKRQEDFAWVYNNATSSCMARQKHEPVKAYAGDGTLAMAVMRNVCDYKSDKADRDADSGQLRAVLARTVVNRVKKTYARIYALTEEVRVAMETQLHAMGFQRGALGPAPMSIIQLPHYEGRGRVLVPYLDMDTSFLKLVKGEPKALVLGPYPRGDMEERAMWVQLHPIGGIASFDRGISTCQCCRQEVETYFTVQRRTAYFEYGEHVSYLTQRVCQTCSEKGQILWVRGTQLLVNDDLVQRFGIIEIDGESYLGNKETTQYHNLIKCAVGGDWQTKNRCVLTDRGFVHNSRAVKLGYRSEAGHVYAVTEDAVHSPYSGFILATEAVTINLPRDMGGPFCVHMRVDQVAAVLERALSLDMPNAVEKALVWVARSKFADYLKSKKLRTKQRSKGRRSIESVRGMVEERKVLNSAVYHTIHTKRRAKKFPAFMGRIKNRSNHLTSRRAKVNADLRQMEAHMEWLDEMIEAAKMLAESLGTPPEMQFPWACITGTSVDYVAAALGVDGEMWFPKVRRYYDAQKSKEQAAIDAALNTVPNTQTLASQYLTGMARMSSGTSATSSVIATHGMVVSSVLNSVSGSTGGFAAPTTIFTA